MTRRLALPTLAVLAAVACVLSGLLPASDARAVVVRAAPVLGFLLAASALAELADRAQVFEVAARQAARLARGRVPALFTAVVALAVTCTVLLGLDTTAVLLTPAVLSLCAQTGLAPWPYALTVVWLANTSSLLLPVSNLTNLLAVDRLDLTARAYAAGFALPTAGAVAVTVAVVVVLHARSLTGRYEVPAPTPVRDRPLLLVVGACCAALVPLVLMGVRPWLAGLVVALVALAATARRAHVPRRLVPGSLAVGVLAAFVVVSALAPRLLSVLLPTGLAGAVPVAVVGAIGSNAVDNLPAFLALEPLGAGQDLRALLIGVDLGPLITPWASLATLLWAQQCRARGVPLSWWRFVASGALLVPLLLLTTVPALPS